MVHARVRRFGSVAADTLGYRPEYARACSAVLNPQLHVRQHSVACDVPLHVRTLSDARSGTRHRRRDGLAVSRGGLGTVFLLFGSTALLAAIVVALFAVETKGRVLEEVSP